MHSRDFARLGALAAPIRQNRPTKGRKGRGAWAIPLATTVLGSVLPSIIDRFTRKKEPSPGQGRHHRRQFGGTHKRKRRGGIQNTTTPGLVGPPKEAGYIAGPIP